MALRMENNERHVDCNKFANKKKRKITKGKIRINAHFFEDGNVQLKEVKNIEEKLGLTGNDPLGESAYIVELIEKLETKLQTGLDFIYESMPDTFFKTMRRILPCSFFNIFFSYLFNSHQYQNGMECCNSKNYWKFKTINLNEKNTKNFFLIRKYF